VVFATRSGASAVADSTGICKSINYAGMAPADATGAAGA
jgi:hypothetical protein